MIRQHDQHNIYREKNMQGSL